MTVVSKIVLSFLTVFFPGVISACVKSYQEV